MEPNAPKRGMFRKFCLAAGMCVLSFLILEGLGSTLFVIGHGLPSGPQTLSGRAVRYDADLGWSPVPNFSDRNYFAPATPLQTNSRGFRSSEELAPQVPAGKIRVICSGDSFTFGEGVGNDDTWCQFLESLDNRIQAVNLGESGYGVDQMYLRYLRDGAPLDHGVHIFAFITEDFRRMWLSNYIGYEKPFLTLQDGQLVAENTPVPNRAYSPPWTDRLLTSLADFRSMQLARDLRKRAMPTPEDAFSNGPDERQAQVLDKMFENLRSAEAQRNGVLLLLYLPTTLHDFEQGGGSPAWRKWLRDEAAKRGILLVDLVGEFQAMSITMKNGYFIWPGSEQYFAAGPGHYDDEGHLWVAKHVYAKLASLTQFAGKVARRPETHSHK